ncbi:MAG: dihydroneopterin aldolase [Clostridia bacterium]|nr:dihydroneopterin aldolase [Clostridia bacterium]
MDKIKIKGLKLFAFHGVNPEEQEDGQYFVLDIEAEASLIKACQSDDIDDTVSYAQMIKCARRVFIAEKNALIERAAQRVADALLNEFSLLQRVKVTCKKPDAPIKADFDYVAVEIVRTRE